MDKKQGASAQGALPAPRASACLACALGHGIGPASPTHARARPPCPAFPSLTWSASLPQRAVSRSRFRSGPLGRWALDTPFGKRLEPAPHPRTCPTSTTSPTLTGSRRRRRHLVWCDAATPLASVVASAFATPPRSRSCRSSRFEESQQSTRLSLAVASPSPRRRPSPRTVAALRRCSIHNTQ